MKSLFLTELPIVAGNAGAKPMERRAKYKAEAPCITSFMAAVCLVTRKREAIKRRGLI